MAKIILKSDINIQDTGYKSTVTNGYINDFDILKKRSKKYLDLIAELDEKTLTDTKSKVELMKAIQEEFGKAEIYSLPLGIVSKCFLGHPYEVHTLVLFGNEVIKHYKINETMDLDFEKARTIAKHNAYAMVEVYKDKLILIREDGTANKL